LRFSSFQEGTHDLTDVRIARDWWCTEDEGKSEPRDAESRAKLALRAVEPVVLDLGQARRQAIGLAYERAGEP